uniref:DUF6534 domain-containing protein n=1 Tax=Moniliophthora roreri TaxID=221103 RepID=A0A0W0EZT6_MONRR
MAPLALTRRMENPPSLDVRNINAPEMVGAVEFGVFISTFLLGTIVAQGYTYFSQQYNKKDSRVLKALIWFLLALEFGHSLSSMATVYYFTVTIADQPVKPGNCYALCLTVIHNALITAVVQTFYVDRCRRLGDGSAPKFFIGVVGWGLTMANMAFGLWVGYEAWLDVPAPNAYNLQLQWGWLISVRLGLQALIDMLIAGCMCFYLKKSEKDLGKDKFKSMSKLLNRLVVWTIETGLATSVTSVVVLVCFQTMKFNYIWIGVYLSLAKFYSISLLASLNARSRYRTKYNGMHALLTASPANSKLRFGSSEANQFTVCAVFKAVHSGFECFEEHQGKLAPTRRLTINS